MISRLLHLFRLFAGESGAATTLDAPNGKAVIYLWRRFFEEEQARLEAERNANDGATAANDDDDNNAVAAAVDPIDRPENRELRQEFLKNHYLDVTGRPTLSNAMHSIISAVTASQQEQHHRVVQDEERVLRPNTQVPAGHDPAMYLAQ